MSRMNDEWIRRHEEDEERTTMSDKPNECTITDVQAEPYRFAIQTRERRQSGDVTPWSTIGREVHLNHANEVMDELKGVTSPSLVRIIALQDLAMHGVMECMGGQYESDPERSQMMPDPDHPPVIIKCNHAEEVWWDWNAGDEMPMPAMPEDWDDGLCPSCSLKEGWQEQIDGEEDE